MHFRAKFSLVLECIRSVGGGRAPFRPLESATAFVAVCSTFVLKLTIVF